MGTHSINRRSALVHDFFVTDGGAERCAIEFASLLPDADIFTTFFDRNRFAGAFDAARVHPWRLQGLLGAPAWFRSLLPLYAAYFMTRDLGSRALVLSNSIAFSKAVKTSPSTMHIAYVHSPMRYAWDLDRYLDGSSLGRLSRWGARAVGPVLRRWDVATAQRPDVIVANSRTVQDRIKRLWGRDSELIYPPVDVARLPLGTRDDGYLFVAARHLAYRRLDLAVQAARMTGRRLIVAGSGPEGKRLRSLAGPETTFVGHVGSDELWDLFARCHAYLVPGIEDFGIAPVEAMAAGKPVVAFRAGGATESVVEGVSGVFFDAPSADSLAGALDQLDSRTWYPADIRRSAERFDRLVFRQSWRDLFGRLGVDATMYTSESDDGR